jgi:hypothetical protein
MKKASDCGGFFVPVIQIKKNPHMAGKSFTGERLLFISYTEPSSSALRFVSQFAVE